MISHRPPKVQELKKRSLNNPPPPTTTKGGQTQLGSSEKKTMLELRTRVHKLTAWPLHVRKCEINSSTDQHSIQRNFDCFFGLGKKKKRKLAIVL